MFDIDDYEWKYGKNDTWLKLSGCKPNDVVDLTGYFNRPENLEPVEMNYCDKDMNRRNKAHYMTMYSVVLDKQCNQFFVARSMNWQYLQEQNLHLKLLQEQLLLS